MFAVQPSPHQFAFGGAPTSPYRPVVSSPLSSSPMRPSSSPPLSPLDANALPRLRETQSSPIVGASASKPIPFKFATRTARPNPLVQKRDDAREGRRKLFLNNVRQRAEDKKWERRGGENEIMRLEWFRLNREFIQAKNADVEGLIQERDLEDATLLLQEEEEEAEARSAGMEVDIDDQMIDALEHQEAAELDAILSSLPQSSYGQVEPGSPHFSDDDDYDALFAEFLQQTEGNDIDMAASQDVEML